MSACTSSSDSAVTTTTVTTSISTTTVTANTSTTTNKSKLISFTLAISGDTLPHSQLWAGAQRNSALAGNPNGYDFRPMFARVKPLISSVDLAICHLETPIAPVGEPLSTYPFFGVPSEITDALADAGYDRCSTASNHTMDRGTSGIDTTLNALDRVGISQAGMARTPKEIEPKLISVNGISVAHMSYTFSYNGLPAANGETWRSALIDSERILSDVHQAKQIGAEVVIISMHWGNERESAPSAFQQQIADEITKSGEIDLIVGHHAHVLQPIKEVNGTWVIYGLGNFLSNMPTVPKDPPWPASTQDGAIVTTRIALTSDGQVTVDQPVVTPTWVDRISGWQIRLVNDDLNNIDITGSTRAELLASLRRTKKVLGDYIRN